MTDKGDRPFRRALRRVHNRIVALAFFLVLGLGLHQVHYHPETPLPTEWNVALPLRVSDPVTPITSWKLRRALGAPAECLAVVGEVAEVRTLPPREESENCHIRNRVELGSIGTVRLEPVETSCAIALRTAMWVEHGLRPAVTELGTELRQILHIGSYNCRPMRTGAENETRWSTHATADALDIAGFVMEDGRRITLLDEWGTGGPEAIFLLAARDSACDWFATTLGPEFNPLHADHFHLQARGWGTCR